jgi:hypothetical protein
LKIKSRTILFGKNPAFYFLSWFGLLFSDFEYFCTTSGADALVCGLTILHGNALGILHFFLLTALNAITLHVSSLNIFYIKASSFGI